MAIKRSKSLCFKELCDKVDENPWEGAYKVVMFKIKSCRGQAPTYRVLLRNVVKTLFPIQSNKKENIEVDENANSTDAIDIVTDNEVILASELFGNAKAPSLDGILNRALKMAIKNCVRPFVEVYKKCFDDGVFPRIWKIQRLVLLPKPRKPPGDPSSYRPLCMIDTIGKILERLLCNRLEQHLERGAEGLSGNQYGFRRGR